MILSLYFKDKWKRLRFMKYALFLLLIFTNPLIHHFVFNSIEHEPINFDDLPKSEVGILLGGYADTEMNNLEIPLQIDLSGNRLLTTLELYKRKKINKILLSGGNGNLFNKNKNEAVIVRNFLLRMNIDSSDIFIDSLSRNTYENGIYSKQILLNNYGRIPSTSLITSDFHLWRAQAVFSKLGINSIIVPSDKKAKLFEWNLNDAINPDPNLLKDWQYLIKEWFGLIAYKLNGYI